jgi:hypothetical protein
MVSQVQVNVCKVRYLAFYTPPFMEKFTIF